MSWQAEGVPDKLIEAGLTVAADEGSGFVLRGNTYPLREAIKRAGGRWDGARRVWLVDSADRLKALAAALGEAGVPAPGLSEVPAKPSSGWGSKHYHGHRGRLRERLLQHKEGSLADYELLELLLFFSVYRRDTKPAAKALLERFGSLGAVLAAEPARYADCAELVLPQCSDPERREALDEDLRFTQVLLKAVQAFLLRVGREAIKDRAVIGSWTALIDYLHAAMAHEPAEQFRLLFLDRKNILIKDEVQSRGTVDHTPLYPREVVKRALELAASAIIMVHNHPSGDPTPSKADIEMTRQVIQALEPVGITLHDHVVIGKNRHLSFRTERLI